MVPNKKADLVSIDMIYAANWVRILLGLPIKVPISIDPGKLRAEFVASKKLLIDRVKL